MEEKNKICSKDAVEYFNGDELAATVWQSKYALKDREDNVYETTPADMHRRLAKEFARIEAKYPNGRSEQEIYDAIDHFRYIIPQGSPMSGIGNNFSIQSLSNCFVIESPHDSYGGIMRADEELLQIEKRRGGCIEENTNVIIKGKGYVKIKDVKVGDEILAFDINTRKDTWRKVKDVYVTEVKLEDQVVLKYENGAILETSKKHPVLKLSDNGYEFKTVESGELDNSWNKTFNDCVLDKSIDDLIKLTKEEKEYFASNDNVKSMLCYSDTTRFEKSIKDIDKNDNCMSVFSIECIHKYGLISDEQYNEICSRVQIESIDPDNEVKKVYYDISVEVDNNYYAGKHGFVNIHNCGVDLSNLRPSNAAVSNAAKTSSGVASFMERYSNSTREVAQNNRRGALMLSLSVKHPDVDKFIDAKLEQGKVTGANISVRLTDEFMRAVVNGDKFTQQWPVDSDNPEIVKEIDARELWNKIVKNAHDSAEPGILFWDTIIRESIADCYDVSGYKSVTCNPCSELTLSPYDSCRLLSLNLYSFVENPFTKDAYFNMDLFKKHIHLAARMMDDLIDLELEKVEKIISKVEGDKEPEDIKYVELNLWKKIREATSKARRTGLGITAEGDMLAAMGLRYASDEAIEFSENVHKTIAIEAYRESAVMAKERGTFAVYDKEKEKDNPFLNRLFDADSSLKDIVLANGRRNIGMLTIAPTGTTSLMSQTTSGIEPAFLIVYKRRRKVNPNDPNVNIAYKDEVGDCFEEYYVFHHNFITWCKVNGYDVEKVKNMPIEEINELVKKSPYYKSTSADIDWVAKVKMQGAIQKWVDHSISVTVNLPKDTPVEVVDKVYMTAWECGCKGMTIYVDGSRSGVLISTENKVENKSLVKPTKRPASLEADVVRFRNNSESWIAFIGKMDGKPYEVFTGVASDDTINIPKYVESGWIVKSKDKDGRSVYNFEYTNKYGYPQVIGGISYMFNKEYWNYARFISGILRNGIPIVDVLNIINSLSLEEDTINTWKNGVSRALKRYIPDGTKDETGKKCSQCGSDSLVYQEGCLVCTNCGYSKCG